MTERNWCTTEDSSNTFTFLWEELCKEQVLQSYRQDNRVSVYTPLTRNSLGEIIGSEVDAMSKAPTNEVDFWLQF